MVHWEFAIFVAWMGAEIPLLSSRLSEIVTEKELPVY
jgi:hypothetical protein